MVDEVLSAALVREPLPNTISGGLEDDAETVAITEPKTTGDDIRAH